MAARCRDTEAAGAEEGLWQEESGRRCDEDLDTQCCRLCFEDRSRTEVRGEGVSGIRTLSCSQLTMCDYVELDCCLGEPFEVPNPLLVTSSSDGRLLGQGWGTTGRRDGETLVLSLQSSRSSVK